MKIKSLIIIPLKIKLIARNQRERKRSFLFISPGILSRLGEDMAAGWHQIYNCKEMGNWDGLVVVVQEQAH